MRVRFWGTRGSIATPGAATNHFGGNTSCVELSTRAGGRYILDCGTGARGLGIELIAGAPRPIEATLLLSHTHWDHIQGLPFFGPLFLRDTRITVCAPKGGGRSLQSVLAGQMEFTYFPVELDDLPARLTCRDLEEGTHELGGARVSVRYLNHPAITLGYRVEADGVSVLYLCDHEPFSETLWALDREPGRLDSILHAGDRRHAEFMKGADLVIHDAQYTPEEYRVKKTWGHSTYEYAVELAAAAGVRRLVLTHHDPVHDDGFVAEIEGRARELAASRRSGLEVACAFEGYEIALEPGETGRIPPRVVESAAPARGARILVIDDDADLLALARRALSRDGHTVLGAADGAEGLRRIDEWQPELVILDLVMPEMDGIEVLRSMRARPETARRPVLILTAHDDEASVRAGFDVGATDYLTKPFSMPQLAARVHACLARAALPER